MPFIPPGVPQDPGDIYTDSTNGVTYTRTAAGQWRVVSNKQGKFKSVGEYAPIFLGAEPIHPEKGHIWYPTAPSEIGKSYIYDGTAWIPLVSTSPTDPVDVGIY